MACKYKCKTGETLTIPTILEGYMETTEQFCEDPLSKEHILNEAEWCLYNAYQNEGSAAYAHHPRSKTALQRFVDMLRSDGIKPKDELNR